MGRLEEMFSGLKGKRSALIAYATAYYPDRDVSEKAMLAMLEAGADALEIGIPFSDPVMDGPVIQDASHAALREGATPAGVLDMAASLRRGTGKPIIAMTYYNPVFRYGVNAFARDAAAAGLDALVVPDLPAGEMGPLADAGARAGLETVAFCSPTSKGERIDEAAGIATGFLYCIALLGPTGARDSVSRDLPAFLERVRARTDLPLAVGLGISTPEQCSSVGRLADGVIVGSALVRALGRSGDPRDPADLVRAMASALTSAPAPDGDVKPGLL